LSAGVRKFGPANSEGGAKYLRELQGDVHIRLAGWCHSQRKKRRGEEVRKKVVRGHQKNRVHPLSLIKWSNFHRRTQKKKTTAFPEEGVKENVVGFNLGSRKRGSIYLTAFFGLCIGGKGGLK